MCDPTTCKRDCIKAAHATTEARDKARATCVCDQLAPELAALIAGGMEQREASLRLWGAA